MNYKKILLVLICFSQLHFLEAENAFDSEIVVTLSKADQLLPIEIKCSDAEFMAALTFDLDNNGMTEAVSKGAALSLEVAVQGHEASAVLISHRTGQKNLLGTYKLCGRPALDRRTMHQIADAAYEAITGKKGIAASQIFFAIQFPDGDGWKSEIWTSDYDGKNVRQLTKEKNYCITPALFKKEGAFTRNKYLYVNYKLGQPKIYINSFGSAEGKPLISLRGNQLLPAVSPKGDMIAFISDASGRADLFIHQFDPDQGLLGKPIQLYSLPHSVQASPTFCPDGKKLAFVSDQGGTPRIYLITIPLSHTQTRPTPMCLTNRYKQNACPSWSPDSTKLAYSAMIDGIRQIMVYDFITQEEIQLTTGKSHKENPSWAQNSMHIIYNSVEPSSSELFLINLKQKKPVKISEGPGKKHYPAWGP